MRRVIFVGAPNGGTVLAHPNHMVGMIDRLTTILNVLPTGNVAELLEAILALVKIIGHGALGGLDGLASMRPGGPFLNLLNSAPPAQAEYFGITADYAPGDEALRVFLKRKVADALMDRVFEKNANDLIVPTRGVFEVEGSPNFPIHPERLLAFESTAAVTHTSYFAHPHTVQAISQWLS